MYWKEVESNIDSWPSNEMLGGYLALIDGFIEYNGA